jgi:hypothetical protein
MFQTTVKRLGKLDAGVEPPKGCPPRPLSLSLGAWVIAKIGGNLPIYALKLYSGLDFTPFLCGR